MSLAIFRSVALHEGVKILSVWRHFACLTLRNGSISPFVLSGRQPDPGFGSSSLLSIQYSHVCVVLAVLRACRDMLMCLGAVVSPVS
jgi:hypothetical protein